MEQFKNQSSTLCPHLFDPADDQEPPVKIGTEVFDSTLPSELEFDEEVQSSSIQNSKGEFSLFQNRVEEDRKDSEVLAQISENKEEVKKKVPSQYQMLTNTIVTFTFHKKPNIMFGQPQYTQGSYIPHFLKIKTFGVKFRDEESQLSNGVSKLKLLWKSVVGYVKTQIYINSGTIYLLERRQQGFLVKSSWSLSDLFKVFSDRQQKKSRLIFRVDRGGQIKLITKQLEQVDLNLLATLLAETGESFDISSE